MKKFFKVISVLYRLLLVCMMVYYFIKFMNCIGNETSDIRELIKYGVYSVIFSVFLFSKINSDLYNKVMKLEKTVKKLKKKLNDEKK